MESKLRPRADYVLQSIAPLKKITSEDISVVNFSNKIHNKYFSDYFRGGCLNSKVK